MKMKNSKKSNAFLVSNALKPTEPMGKTIKVLEQTGKINSYIRDRGRKAKLPGKRISKSGKVYWETRKNRSDEANKAL